MTASDTTRLTASTPSLWVTGTTMVRWNLAQTGMMLPVIIVVQAMLATGLIVGFGFLIPDIDDVTALRLSTGTPTVLLLMLGLVIVPQGVSTARTNGTFTYLRSLPVPRTLLLMADLLTWLAVALPGMVLALVVAVWRFGISFEFAWGTLLLGAALVTITATAVGYAIAVSVQPMAALALTQVLGFLVMLFSPINFPAQQLPDWYQKLHHYLPVESGANLIRAGLASGTFQWHWRDLAVLSVWTVIGLAISLRALSTRR